MVRHGRGAAGAEQRGRTAGERQRLPIDVADCLSKTLGRVATARATPLGLLTLRWWWGWGWDRASSKAPAGLTHPPLLARRPVRLRAFARALLTLLTGWAGFLLLGLRRSQPERTQRTPQHGGRGSSPRAGMSQQAGQGIEVLSVHRGPLQRRMRETEAQNTPQRGIMRRILLLSSLWWKLLCRPG